MLSYPIKSGALDSLGYKSHARRVTETGNYEHGDLNTGVVITAVTSMVIYGLGSEITIDLNDVDQCITNQERFT